VVWVQPGTVYLKQTLQFRTPVLVGQRLHAAVNVKRVSSRRCCSIPATRVRVASLTVPTW
jgi:acyl dehydratase